VLPEKAKEVARSGMAKGTAGAAPTGDEYEQVLLERIVERPISSFF
jgi:hypothetical protein